MIIDARGKACPMPVIMAKKELDNGCKELTVTVDNAIAVENLTKLGESMGVSVSFKQNGIDFEVSFNGDAQKQKKESESENKSSYAVFIGKDFVGDGEYELGANLMKMAIYTLSESSDVPQYLLFMNSGVKLLVKDQTQICDNVKTLIEKGCKILVCGTCLNFYGISEQLGVGQVSNMYDILTAMQKSNKVITL